MMWGHTARKTFLSEKIEGGLHKTLWKWWNFRKFRSWMQKIFQKKKCKVFKSARKQLHCVLWCNKTHAADYNDLLRPLYHWIWVILHFAVSERLVMSYFFKNDMKIRKKRKIKIRRESIENTFVKGGILRISHDLTNIEGQVFRPYRWILTVLCDTWNVVCPIDIVSHHANSQCRSEFGGPQ